MIEQLVSALASVVGLAVSEPRALIPLAVAVLWARWKYDRLSAAGLIKGVTRAGLVGFVMMVVSVAGFYLVLRDPKRRAAAVTALLCAGAIVALAVAWWVPALRWKVLAPAVLSGMVLLFFPGDWLYRGQPGGVVWEWLGGELPTVANIRAAMERDRRAKLLPAALAACTETAQVREQRFHDDGRITLVPVVDAGASPAELAAMVDDGTFVNAVNRIAERDGADVVAVDARMRNGEIELDTAPRRLPEVAPWPGN